MFNRIPVSVRRALPSIGVLYFFRACCETILGKHGPVIRILAAVAVALMMVPAAVNAWDRLHPRPKRRRSREREAAVAESEG